MSDDYEQPDGEMRDHENSSPLMLDRITVKDFDNIQSSIPASLMSRLTQEEQYLFATVSKISEQNRWLAQNQVRQNAALRAVIRKQQTQETWRVVFSTKWGLLAWAGGLIVSVLVIEGGKKLLTFLTTRP